ncbi:MAG: hypothetical protein NT015_16965 [Alphaproteobacteria bacterium]|nr:hypothetical protein [Alphaproteobacteria bacterium]
MSRQPVPSQRGGAFGLLLVFCLTAFIGGFGFDLGTGARLRFWIGDQPAAAAAVGIAATLFMVLVGHAGRFALSRKKPNAKIEGEGDGRIHS